MTPEQQRASNMIWLGFVGYREGRQYYLTKPTAILAIIYSILTRVASPAWWGHDVLTVIEKAWQYSSLTNPKDKQLTVWPIGPAWDVCVALADAALAGAQPDPARLAAQYRGSDSYYDTSIPAPPWATPDKFVIQIGNLRFYKLQADHEIGPLKAAGHHYA
jgi:N-acetylmuramoyl-L-alanine amidase